MLNKVDNLARFLVGVPSNAVFVLREGDLKSGLASTKNGDFVGVMSKNESSNLINNQYFLKGVSGTMVSDRVEFTIDLAGFTFSLKALDFFDFFSTTHCLLVSCSIAVKAFLLSTVLAFSFVTFFFTAVLLVSSTGATSIVSTFWDSSLIKSGKSLEKLINKITRNSQFH